MQQARQLFPLVALTAALVAPPAHGQTAARARGAPKPGQTFKECRSCPEMTVLLPGTVTIGSPPDEPLRRDNEPQKKIALARPFAIATTAVTWDQWPART